MGIAVVGPRFKQGSILEFQLQSEAPLMYAALPRTARFETLATPIVRALRTGSRHGPNG